MSFLFSFADIAAVAILNGMVLSLILLLNRRGNRTANRLLAVLVVLLSASLWNLYVGEQGLPAYLKGLDSNRWTTPFFWGPVLYLFVSAVVGQQPVTTKRIMRHSALGLAVLGLDIAFLSPSLVVQEPFYSDLQIGGQPLFTNIEVPKAGA